MSSQFLSFFHWILFDLLLLLRDSENDLLRWPGRKKFSKLIGVATHAGFHKLPLWDSSKHAAELD